MAIFEIEAGGKTYEVEAPDQGAALAAFDQFSGGAGQTAASQPKADNGRIPILSDFKDFSDAFQTAATEGMTLGFADEINAGVQAPFRAIGSAVTGNGFDLGKEYNEGLKGTRSYIEEQTAKNPAAAVAGDVVGSLVTGGTLAKGGVTLLNGAKATIPSLAGRSAVEGAIYGGVSGFGRSEGDLPDRLIDAGEGALWGGGVGGVVGGAVGALAGRAAKSAVPTVDDLKAAAKGKYDAARASGVQASQSDTIALSDQMHDIAVAEGLVSPTGRVSSSYSKIGEALRTFDDYANGAMSVKQMQAVRKTLQDAAASPDKGERRIAVLMLEEMDKFTSGIAPQLREGDALYSAAMKGRTIEKAIKRAKVKASMYSNGGQENALRTEFRRLALAIEDGKVKGFSPEEIEAIKKVADGGGVENLARWVGKAAPTGIVSAGMGAGVPFMLGNAIGGPGLGATLAGGTMAAGLGGKAVAGAMTGSNATRAALLARNAGRPLNNTQALAGPNSAVLRALIAAGGNEAGQVPFYLSSQRSRVAIP